MNAAARDINQTNFFHGQLINLKISLTSIFHFGFMMAVLLSSIAVVYTTNCHRLMLNRTEAAEQQSNRLQLAWGQLLLEQASLVTPSRVEYWATQQLKMHLPSSKNVIVLHKK